MIENPKVGQRVAVYDVDGLMHLATVVRAEARPHPRQPREYLVRDGGWMAWRPAAELRDASALRAEAQRLMDAADKLESEEPNAD